MSRLDDLANKIKNYSKEYYAGNPLISDAEFDRLVEDFRELAPDHEILTEVGWGGLEDLSNDSDKVRHLSKLTGIGDKRKLDYNSNVSASDYYLTPKLDGGSLELQYSNGVLMKALTRGNGEYGFDVTSSVIGAKGVLTKLKKKFTGSIIGEFLISSESLKEFAPEGSQRNVPNGFLSRKSIEGDSEYFTFISYKIGAEFSDNEIYSSSKLAIDRQSILQSLSNLGLLVVPIIPNDTKYNEVMDNYSKIDGETYLLDGVVASPKIVEFENSRYDYGHEIAYKAQTESAVTTVVDIDWNLTKFNKLIPTVVFENVQLSGASIYRALAHNARYVLDNGIGPGAKVEITRSGEVIPYILGVPSRVDADIPSECPSCHQYLYWSGVDIVCENPLCPNDKYSRLANWFFSLAYVKGLGSSVYHKLAIRFDLNDIEDLYKPEFRAEVINYPDSAFKRVILECLERLDSEHSLEEVLTALRIPGLGWSSASRIVSNTSIRDVLGNYNDDSFFKFTSELLFNVPRVSRKVKDSIINNWEYISYLINNYVLLKDSNPTNNLPQNSDLIKICITGKVPGFTKKKFYEEYSDIIIESRVEDCDYLICNESKGSSKENKAKSLGKSLINYNEFLEEVVSHARLS